MENIIEVNGLTKSYGDFLAVDDLSFKVGRGQIYGFLGQNGAGKSTTMRMLLGLIHPTTGDIMIDGGDIKRNRYDALKNIGAIIERPDLYGYLSAWDNLRMFARLSKKRINEERLEEVIHTVGLNGREHDKVKNYSQGMKQRLGIAVALVHDPELLILDEPTNGLDPQGIAEMRELIRTLGTHLNKTIVISSHLLYEIEQVATHMLIIHKGRKIVEGKVSDLLSPNETLFDIRILPDDGIKEKIMGKEWGEYLVQDSDASLIKMKMHPRKMPALNRFLVQEKVHVLEIRSKHSLEAYFLSLTTDADVEN